MKRKQPYFFLTERPARQFIPTSPEQMLILQGLQGLLTYTKCSLKKMS